MVVKSMRNRGEDPATPLCLQERESNVQGAETTLYYDGGRTAGRGKVGDRDTRPVQKAAEPLREGRDRLNAGKETDAMTIAEVSREIRPVGGTPLRYYERIGLIPPVPRTKSGIRDYDEESCNWIELMKCMRARACRSRR